MTVIIIISVTFLTIFQSTPSAWRVTIDRMSFAFTVREISIHTLRVEGDVWWDLFKMVFVLFQSTPSAWRVTLIWLEKDINLFDFNPHPPRGG